MHRLTAIGFVVTSLSLGACGLEGRANGVAEAPSSTLVPTPTVAGTASVTAAPPTTTTSHEPEGDLRTVERIVDGDTIVIDGDERVRLIGIDTPESVDPRQPVQCLGQEAAAYTASLLPPGTPVRLVYDIERTDRFGRTLAYVHRAEDGLFVNADLLTAGYAVTATFPPNVAHVDEFAALAAAARDAGSGLWSACDAHVGSAPLPEVSSGCDPSYPDVCIPPSPPDLDCGDITFRRFRVVEPDPHRFDGDGNGIGCER